MTWLCNSASKLRLPNGTCHNKFTGALLWLVVQQMVMTVWAAYNFNSPLTIAKIINGIPVLDWVIPSHIAYRYSCMSCGGIHSFNLLHSRVPIYWWGRKAVCDYVTQLAEVILCSPQFCRKSSRWGNQGKWKRLFICHGAHCLIVNLDDSQHKTPAL